MKKIILSMILCAVAFVAKAQIESVDFKSNFRSDFGVGAGITVDLGNDFEFSPSANLYFWDCGTHIDFEADFHYNIDLGKNFTLYPIAGGVLSLAGDGEREECVAVVKRLVLEARWAVATTVAISAIGAMDVLSCGAGEGEFGNARVSV